MADFDASPFERFLESARSATNESQKRHAFTVLAAKGFADNDLATKLALGSEYQVRFQSHGLIRRGAADSYFGSLLIEFEFDIRKSGDEALEQLRAYVAGAWTEDGSTTRTYLAVATDGLRWATYVAKNAGGWPVTQQSVQLVPSEQWVASGTPEDAEELRQFLNRMFYRQELLAPTTANFARDFGVTAPAFVATTELLRRKYLEVRTSPQLEVLQRTWSDSLQLAYGSVAADSTLFIKHTYLANLARLLVWTAIERRAPTGADVREVMSGDYFKGKQVANLVEADFFRWHEIPSITESLNAWVALGRHLSGYDLGAVNEDVLKPLYEQLVDPDSRHDLGEYYTPDWLATAMTEHLLSTWDWSTGSPRVLDPTCGSGTFLRVTIEILRRTVPFAGRELLDAILESVVGIDVHPLAVVIARATYLLAVKDLIAQAQAPINIPVYLANSLQLAQVEWTPSLFETTFTLAINDTEYLVPLDFVRHSVAFDDTIEELLTVAEGFGNAAIGEIRQKDVEQAIRTRLADRLAFLNDDALLGTVAMMAYELAGLIRAGLDSIYGYLLRNHYRPAMLRRAFDYVVGNPPWLTVSDIGTEDYKRLVIDEGRRYGVASNRAGEIGHTELAAIFLAHVTAVFLKSDAAVESSRIAFVMPRSIVTATHHRMLRDGSHAVSMQITELWDLVDVHPLFNVPACVAFAKGGSRLQGSRMPGRVWEGQLPRKDVAWGAAQGKLHYQDVEYGLIYLGKRSTWLPLETGEASGVPDQHKVQPYVRAFSQGAILYPQTLIIVEPDSPLTPGQRLAFVRTNPTAAADAKIRTDAVAQMVNVSSLYRTAAAEHIVPFALLSPLWLAVLPAISQPGHEDFRCVSAGELRRAGLIETAAWLDWAQQQWEAVRKEGDDSELYQRLNHLGHMDDQADMKRYVVLYAASGGRPVAATLDTSVPDRPFVARDKTYWASFDTVAEASYLASFLNSEYAAAHIRAWMTRGLFGPRDIHKRVLDVPWPVFEASNRPHQELARLGVTLTETAGKLVHDARAVTATRRRDWVRARLSPVAVGRVEALVTAISQGVPSFYTSR